MPRMVRILSGGVVQLHDNPGGNDSYTKLLLHADGTGATFTDSSASNHTITANGDATQSSTQSKFGGKSAYFDGTGDYLSTPDDADWALGTGDFTIDCWVYFTKSLSSDQGLVGQGSSSSSQWALYWDPTQGIKFFSQTGGTTYININQGGTSGWSTNTWYHIAVVRNGNSFIIYRDGTSVASGTDADSVDNTSATLNVGVGNQQYFGGYMDEIRISNGIARWTGNFTSPTSAYTGSTYPTSQAYYITTAAGSQIDTSTWTEITSVTLTQTTPASTTLLYLVSFDGRTTWKYWTGSAWAASSLANLQTNGMDKTTVEAITQAQWGASGGFTAGTLDFAFDLKTTDSTVTPSLDLITANYNLPQHYEIASTGKYGSSADYGVKRNSSTQTTFKKQSTGSAKVYLNAITY